MSKIYFTGQPRFGMNPSKNHDVVRSAIWDDEESMNEDLINYWNETVQSNDLIYIMGEFFEENVKEKEQNKIIKQLNGNKIFLQNQKDVINKYSNSNVIMYHDIQFVFERNLIHLTNFLEHINTTESNFVITSTNNTLNLKVNENIVHYESKSGALMFRNNLHKLVVDVSVDMWEFRPVGLEQILRIYNEYYRNQSY